MFVEDDFLMISGIQHFLFCQRQWALIHIEQQWAENFLTVEGQHLHQKADQPAIKEKRGDKIVVRSMRVHSPTLGITGICDVVEFTASASGVPLINYPGRYQVVPVEYKHGKEKFDLSDELQLTAQALCLEEMLATQIVEGEIFYFETRQRIKIAIDEEKRKLLRENLHLMHTLWQKQHTPKAKEKPKCQRCSLKEICLPELDGRQKVTTYLKRRLQE